MNQSNNSSKRQARREQIRRKESRGRMVFMGIIVIVALFVAFLIIYPNIKPIASITTIDARPRPQADGNSMGDPNAPVQMVEYADYQCPFCERFFQDTESLIEDTYVATGKVHFTYRSAGNWVSGNMGQGKTESEDSAKAAYCAGDQGMFWEMHDMLFSNVIGEDAGSFTDRRLPAIAEATGLDMTKFNDCYDSNKHQETVDQDFKDAVIAGVNGTPTFVLSYKDASGNVVFFKNIEGAVSFSEFQTDIEAALAASGK
ncbi:MAG: DsbA family protein [Anaerolineales bacterium]